MPTLENEDKTMSAYEECPYQLHYCEELNMFKLCQIKPYEVRFYTYQELADLGESIARLAIKAKQIAPRFVGINFKKG